jgi:hypothetical protein
VNEGIDTDLESGLPEMRKPIKKFSARIVGNPGRFKRDVLEI